MDPVVILGTDVVAVGPGQEQRVPVRIRNQGRRVESYKVDVVGAPAAFAQVIPPLVSVLPGREAELDVVFRPPGGASTPTGSLVFAVRATSEVDASSSAVAEGRLELAGVAGLQAWAPETTRAGRWGATYRVEFANQGNAAVRLALTANDPAGETRLKLEPDVVDMTAGGRTTASLHARARHPFLRGSTANRALQVSCQSFPFGTERPVPGGVPPADDPNHRSFQLSFQQRPILPKFVLPLLALAIVAGLAFAVLTLRKTTGVALDLAPPPPPSGLTVNPNGDDSVVVSWQAVPNAEGYTIAQTRAAGVPAPQELDAGLPATPVGFTASGLQAQTEYCFVVTALGPDGKNSGPSQEGCGTTGAPTNLSPPTDVNVTDNLDGTAAVTWQTTETGADVTFNILVGGNPVVQGATASGVNIPVEPKAVEQVLTITVEAVRGDQHSKQSDPPFSLTVAALPATTPESTAPATTLPTPTTVVVTPTIPGGGTATTTTTTAPTTTTTAPSVAATDLQNRPPTFVALVGSLQAGGAGAVTTEQRLADLAATFGVAPGDLIVFSNRDTIATRLDGGPTEIPGSPPSSRFVAVRANDAAGAAATCQAHPGTTCVPLLLVGAATKSEGSPVLELAVLPPTVTTADLDKELVTRRAQLGNDVYAVSGTAYPTIGSDRVFVFASGLGTPAQIQTVCDQQAIRPCNTRTFPAD